MKGTDNMWHDMNGNMAGGHSRDDYTRIQEAAGLHCEGLTEEDIAIIMDLEKHRVHALLEQGMSLGYYHYQPVYTLPKLGSELHHTLLHERVTHDLSYALENTLHLRSNHVRVTWSPPAMFEHYREQPANHGAIDETYRQAETQSLQNVARIAGRYLARRLFDDSAHTIGLNYGTSVMFTVKEIPILPSRITRKLTIVSLFGDLGYYLAPQPLHKDGYAPCNEIVSLLADKIGEPPLVRKELLSVPVFIPHTFATSKDTFLKIRSFLTQHASYEKIFGHENGDDSSPLFDKIDTIITGVGSVDNYTSLSRFLPLWLSEQESEKLLEYCREGKIAGDLGGHFIPDPAYATGSHDVARFLDRINQRLIAASPDRFKEVAERYAYNPHSGAGVVCAAAGARKAKILFALLNEPSCPLSCLFIDSHCALALLYLIDEEKYTRLISSDNRLFAGAKRWSEETKALIPVPH